MLSLRKSSLVLIERSIVVHSPAIEGLSVSLSLLQDEIRIPIVATNRMICNVLFMSEIFVL